MPGQRRASELSFPKTGTEESHGKAFPIHRHRRRQANRLRHHAGRPQGASAPPTSASTPPRPPSRSRRSARETIGHVVIGNVIQSSADAIYCARHVGLKAGLPITTPAVTVNRLCGSGFEAIVQGASAAPARRGGGGARRRDREHDAGAAHPPRRARGLGRSERPLPSRTRSGRALTDSYTGTPMAITAENLAQKYGITPRSSATSSRSSSQQRWAAANEAGRLQGRDRAPRARRRRRGP